ncbi:hypothetical protein ACNFBT_11035 [Pseudomonas sp. NY15181]|uniref:hypothetical protein n=1 Tax=Pseudomonas sp. NY15181 TaxID=3400349 RepID=UPI003A85A9A4
MNARTSKAAMDEAVNAAQLAESALHELSSLRRVVNRRSETINAAGNGLCALANLLGADASEHHMTADLKYGAACAVDAIGELLKEFGCQLWEISEPEEDSK